MRIPLKAVAIIVFGMVISSAFLLFASTYQRAVALDSDVMHRAVQCVRAECSLEDQHQIAIESQGVGAAWFAWVGRLRAEQRGDAHIAAGQAVQSLAGHELYLFLASLEEAGWLSVPDPAWNACLEALPAATSPWRFVWERTLHQGNRPRVCAVLIQVLAEGGFNG